MTFGLTEAVEALAGRVRDIDRQRREGWIDGERAGRTAGAEGTEAEAGA